jgi:exodeoxyribonuclease VII small subunit
MAKADDAKSFESIVAELENVVRQMSAGDIGIEEAAGLYEEARDLDRGLEPQPFASAKVSRTSWMWVCRSRTSQAPRTVPSGSMRNVTRLAQLAYSWSSGRAAP